MDSIATIVLPLALCVIMFTLGLGLSVADFERVLKRPKAFAVGAISQMAAIPLVAFGVATLFRLPPELALGLMILSFCPGGVTSNILAKYARGDVALSISLTGAISLASVVTVPFLVAIFAGHYLGIQARAIDITSLGISVLVISAVPVVFGMTIRSHAAEFAARIEPPLSALSFVLLGVVVIGAVVGDWPSLVSAASTLGPAVLLLSVLLLAAGFGIARLFALSRTEATAISIETGIQNSALGVTVGTLIAEQSGALAPYALPSGVYGIVMYLVCIPFVLWRRRVG